MCIVIDLGEHVEYKAKSIHLSRELKICTGMVECGNHSAVDNRRQLTSYITGSSLCNNLTHWYSCPEMR